MFIEFTQDIGSWKTGEIHDLPDGVGRAFVAGTQAKESDAVSHLRASTASEMAKFKADLMETVRSVVTPQAGNQQQSRKPPGTGQGVDYGKVSQGEYTGTPGFEADKNRCFTDALRSIFLINARDVDPALQLYARNRMRGYSEEFTEYQFNADSGEFTSTVTRSLANGGLETIKRTGTDSLSGGATYGFTLKPDYIGSLYKIAREQEVFASATRRIPVSQGNEVIWPNLNQFSAPTKINGIPQAAVFGGITMSYVGETTARVSSDGAVQENRFKVDDLTGMTDFSRDYIVDNYIAMDSEIVSQFGAAVAWIEDWVTIRGDGVAKPQGFFNANAAITQIRGTSNHIEYEDIVNMMSKLSAMCWMNARWLTNVTCLPDLVAIKNHAGSYVYQPNALLSQAMRPSVIDGSTADEMVMRPMGSMIGIPVYFSEKLPILGTTGDLSLVCPYQYGLAERSGLEVGVSDQFYFSTDRIAYRFKKRHYGKSLWPGPYIQADNVATPASGTKVSPFILLNSATS